MDAGTIKILNNPPDGTFTKAWDTTTATTQMEAIIDAANAAGTKIDGILAENDSTALGTVAALKNKSYGIVPISGQDGDTANLQNVAAGWQYVDVWKDANQLGNAAGAAALQLCKDPNVANVTIPSGIIDAASAPGQPGCPGLHDARQQRREVGNPEGAARHPGQPAEDHRRQVVDSADPVCQRD